LFKQNTILDSKSGRIIVYPAVYKNLSPTKGQIEKFELKQESIKLFGKVIPQPRLSALFGDDNIGYKYSGRYFEATQWTPYLLSMKNQIQKDFDLAFNSVLLNYYRDGNDSMGLHADDEPELGFNPTIVSVSFGETRKMIFRNKLDKEKITFELKDGDLLIMSGSLQHNWKHELPKSRQILGARLNLTFRKIL
jgi:alkylated DNA repair dioxygenase AlkB